MGQGEIGDPHGALPFWRRWWPWSNSCYCWPPVLTMKEMMMPPPTVKMAIGAYRPHRPRVLVDPAPNLHVKCLIFSVRPDEDAESHLLCSNDWMSSQGIVEEEKCARFCLTLPGNVCLWYESIHFVDNDWHLQKLFC